MQTLQKTKARCLVALLVEEVQQWDISWLGLMFLAVMKLTQR